MKYLIILGLLFFAGCKEQKIPTAEDIDSHQTGVQPVTRRYVVESMCVSGPYWILCRFQACGAKMGDKCVILEMDKLIIVGDKICWSCSGWDLCKND